MPDIVGTRQGQNLKPKSLSLAGIRHHYSLIPLFASLGVAVGLATLFSMRMLTKATDISWKKEEAPYNYYANKQYRFISASRKSEEHVLSPEARIALSAIQK